MKRSLVERFWPKVDRRGPDECWPWLAATNYGYGVIGGEDARSLKAHRVAWSLTNGPIPDGLVLDHLCRNRACCNPAHMELVTIGENVMRGETIPARNAAKTHCSNGHPFDPENTYISAQGARVCRRCHALWEAQRRRNQATNQAKDQAHAQLP